MRILVVHNEYRIPGGEDTVVSQEIEVLRKHGHEVVQYRRTNKELDSVSLWGHFMLPFRTVWAHKLGPLRDLVKRSRPDLVHFHNTFVMISPHAHYLCKSMGLPIVQTLHNYRLLCPRADFFRSEHICEECLGRTPPWPGILHACYHSSRSRTAVVAALITTHRLMHTWDRKVDAFVVLTEFARRKFVEGGFSPSKLVVKPNFVTPDPLQPTRQRKYALFVGRFSPVKKILTLLQAWQRIENLQLRVIGSDTSEQTVKNFLQHHGPLSNVDWLGRRTRSEVLAMMNAARFLVFPSEWYEGFPMVIAEAFACGLPVISSRLGSMPEIVEDGRTGLMFTAGEADDLVAKILWAQAHPSEMEQMGRNARREYEQKYTEESNYVQLMAIYDRAINAHNGGESVR